MNLIGCCAIAALSLAPAATPAVGTPADAARAPLSTADLFRMQQVTQAVIAPDGNTIACTIAVPRDPLAGKDGPSWSELWLVGRDGRPRPYITGDVTITGIQFTPNGRHIAFLAKRGADKMRGVYLLPLDGGEARKLFEHETDIASVAFHPTLNRIAFLASPSDKERKAASDRGFSQERHQQHDRSDQGPGHRAALG